MAMLLAPKSVTTESPLKIPDSKQLMSIGIKTATSAGMEYLIDKKQLNTRDTIIKAASYGISELGLAGMLGTFLPIEGTVNPLLLSDIIASGGVYAAIHYYMTGRFPSIGKFLAISAGNVGGHSWQSFGSNLNSE